ncbi:MULTISPECIES: asparagine synthase (glutamine-hydrolyzing) [unclassified Methylobacterium]|uniref:asparagine synthase (glutamine-hydrolyzing) n=1 Tax=unclassified Methylobacterium TaxID=2615210 RepID=UPI00135339DF|nr:asparagine synthase (glutamine-hydrolyzing) [Methylobacterium sp. 2A]MWV24699.1 asparagine synthase (glutamine-hydrolyzing) [Methylobacterium sp. 2A]
MCGIAGLLADPRTVDPETLSAVAAMTERLAHRGPCGSGFWSDPEAGVALGHRRLSIIDLSPAGRQPMHSESARLVVTFNGEIYNFQEIRRDLTAEGYVFRGHSDTEVLLAACETWGLARALERCAGMFALALFDRRERVLHLARDRLGKKPLFVTLAGGALAFASELKAFAALPGFRPSLSRAGVSAFLRQGWIGEDGCIWREVVKLPPGGCLSVEARDLARLSPDDLPGRVRRWWTLEEAIATSAPLPAETDPAAVEEELDRLLRLAVSQRMIADVPLGAFLSGGIDSSLVVALMQQHSGRPVRTYTIGFAEAEYDEADQAARVAAHLGTDHTTFRVTPAEAMAVIPELPEIWDEPFADESQIPTLLLSRLARRDVTVALSGDGGDEGFGGYARHFLYDRIAPLLRVPSGVRRAAASCLTAMSPTAWDDLLRACRVPARLHRALRREKLHKFAHLLTASDALDWYDQVTGFPSGPAVPRRAAGWRPGGLSDPILQILYRDTTEYLPGDILVKVDRASMAVGLECRAPLLDHRVIEFAWRIPLGMKLRGGRGKWILRRLLQRHLGEELLQGKRGFDVPVGAWQRGPLRDWSDAQMNRLDLGNDGLLDRGAVRRAWAEHLSGRWDRSREIWALTMLSAWMGHWQAGAGREPDRAALAPGPAPAREGAMVAGC